MDYNQWSIQQELEAENQLHEKLKKEQEESSSKRRILISELILDNLHYFSEVDEYGNTNISIQHFELVGNSIAHVIDKAYEKGELK